MNTEKRFINTLSGKMIIKGTIKVLTGLHIGTSGDFSAIGAVDNIVVRDSITNKPMIPGSSLKGKMRYLLARTKYSDSSLTMANIKNEHEAIKRLFGGVGKEGEGLVLSRLQFQDMLLSDKSEQELKSLELDLPYTEIKYENTIDRAKGEANPRQQERVPAGSEFDFKLIYNIEKLDELNEDMENLALMMELLQDDYLGGHGTRGYGRVKFENLTVEVKTYAEESKAKDIDSAKYQELLESKVR
ncbi:type III-A CRISPR-associated RAMP protein Csm3 [Filifactor villosus]|uniref:CRISPR system Cms endoribonuclease Csm3 n=1 Tax=Filifactor villosus TaxID=29374 RepID=A0ABV9QHE9_9FIRM